MRAVSTSFFALLILAALLWGNCFSCPQLLLTAVTQAPPHSCCKHPGKAPVTSRADCVSLALKHFVKADPAQKAQLQAVAVAHVAVSEQAGAEPDSRPEFFVAFVHSPPDIQLLNSTFRI